MKKQTILWVRFALVLLGFAVAVGMGCSSSDTGSGTTPVASAGDNQSVLKGATVTLDGTASVGVTSAAWTFTSKPTGSAATLTGSTSLTAHFVADVAGSYVVQLSLNGGASTASATITSKTVLAKITAGSGINNRTAFGQSTYAVNLDATGATLVGTGSQAGSGSTIATYTWSQANGPAATATSALTDSSYVFTAPGLVNLQSVSPPNQYKWQVMPIGIDNTAMVFTLTVADSSGNTDTASATVYVQNSNADMPVSSGLPNVALGNTVIMSGPSLKAATGAATAITDWTWTLTPPAGSGATLSSATSQFPQFTADVQGLYQLTYASTSGGVATATALNVNAGSYVGVGTIGGTTPLNPQCATCHNGVVEPDTVTPWASTMHASLFSNNIALYATQAPTPYLWQTNTVGYGQNAASLGFNTLVSNAGFEFPATGMTYSAFTSGYPTIATLANVQCENCHGPGSGHSGNPDAIAFSQTKPEVCGQCHTQTAQFNNAVHNSTGMTPGGENEQAAWLGVNCSRCHTTAGFNSYVASNFATRTAVSGSDAFTGIGCVACHDPHDATNTNQLRMYGNVTMVADGSTVNAGVAAACYNCHDALYEYNVKSATSGCFTDASAGSIAATATECLTVDQAATTYLRQVHYNSQAPILEGKAAITDLENGDGTGAKTFTLTENSFHSGSTFILSEVTGNSSLSSTNDKCITCHMPTGPGPSETGYQHMGGHSFAMKDGDTENIAACTPCHTTLTSFNRLARADYDGNGTIEGIQDEVKGLLYELSQKIKPYDTTYINQDSGAASAAAVTNASTITFLPATSKTLTSGKNCATATAPRTQYNICNMLSTNIALRRAIWNYNLLVREGSAGVHNAAFDIQVLQKTYTALAQILGGNTFAQDFPNATLR